MYLNLLLLAALDSTSVTKSDDFGFANAADGGVFTVNCLNPIRPQSLVFGAPGASPTAAYYFVADLGHNKDPYAVIGDVSTRSKS